MGGGRTTGAGRGAGGGRTTGVGRGAGGGREVALDVAPLEVPEEDPGLAALKKVNL